MINSSTIDVKDVEAAVGLSADGNRVGCLLVVTAMSSLGSIGNIFLISAVFVSERLRNRGNAFVVNLALADLVITGLVMPMSVIALLAARTDTSMSVCSVQWVLAQISALVTILSMAAIALENLARLLAPKCYSACFTRSFVTCSMLATWTTAIIIGGVQAAYHLGPDYCQRTNYALQPFQLAIGVFLVIVPVSITFLSYAVLACRLRSAMRNIPCDREIHIAAAVQQQVLFVTANFFSFLIFVGLWLPFGVMLIMGTVVSRNVFYYTAWAALSKSVVQYFVYPFLLPCVRKAYVDLFHYCCCKTTVPLAGRRSRDPVGGIRSPGDVRVHIIPAYNINCTSPGRGRPDKAACDL